MGPVEYGQSSMAGQGGAQMNNREKTATTLVHSVNAQFLFISVISEGSLI